jgi:hypothetical protein
MYNTTSVPKGGVLHVFALKKNAKKLMDEAAR